MSKTAFIWLLMLFVVSVFPFGEAPEIVSSSDKIIHFIIYFITAMLFYVEFWRMGNKGPRDYMWMARLGGPIAIAIIFSSLYGLLMELAQGVLTGTRHFSWLDAGANLMGALSAGAVIKIKGLKVKAK